MSRRPTRLYISATPANTANTSRGSVTLVGAALAAGALVSAIVFPPQVPAGDLLAALPASTGSAAAMMVAGLMIWLGARRLRALIPTSTDARVRAAAQELAGEARRQATAVRHATHIIRRPTARFHPSALS